MQCLIRVGSPADKVTCATQVTITIVEHKNTREKSSSKPLEPENLGRNLASAGSEPTDSLGDDRQEEAKPLFLLQESVLYVVRTK